MNLEVSEGAREEICVPGEGRLPDFLVIGAAQSGTTTLYHYQGRHPAIFMSPVKEPCKLWSGRFRSLALM